LVVADEAILPFFGVYLDLLSQLVSRQHFDISFNKVQKGLSLIFLVEDQEVASILGMNFYPNIVE
jgi:hypothetical protein